MKVQHLLFMFAVSAMCLTACDEKQVMPGDNDNNQKALVIPDPTPDPEGFKVPEGAINVYKAVEIAKALKFGEVSKERYLIKGYLTSFNRGETFKDDFPKYGNDFFYLSAVQPSDEQPIHNFYAYRALGKYGAKFPDMECVKEGDFVVISCLITNYNGVFESSGTCFVLASNNEHFNQIYTNTFSAPTLKSGEISVSKAESTAGELPSGQTTTELYKIRGFISGVDEGYGIDDQGRVCFNITDGAAVATCYRTFHLKDKGEFTDMNQIQVGDEIVIESKIQNYNYTCEPAYGWVIESTNPNF